MISVTSLNIDAIGDQAAYDLFVATVGFEDRARCVAEHCQPDARHKIAWEFKTRQVLAFSNNQQWYGANGYDIVEEDDGFPEQWLRNAAAAAGDTEEPLRVCVDISSMTRRRIAMIIAAITGGHIRREISVDFLYALAEFSEPPCAGAANVWAGPVLRSFAGWATEPDSPAVLLLGLGYEPDKAIGAVQLVEPAEVWAFRPISEDARYAARIENANEQLWRMHPSPRAIDYDVHRIYDTFVTLESMLFRMTLRSRPVILPFGPKAFALCSLLVARMHPSVAVWRVSAGQREDPSQRIPTGEIIGLRVACAAVPAEALAV